MWMGLSEFILGRIHGPPELNLPLLAPPEERLTKPSPQPSLHRFPPRGARTAAHGRKTLLPHNGMLHGCHRRLYTCLPLQSQTKVSPGPGGWNPALRGRILRVSGPRSKGKILEYQSDIAKQMNGLVTSHKKSGQTGFRYLLPTTCEGKS